MSTKDKPSHNPSPSPSHETHTHSAGMISAKAHAHPFAIQVPVLVQDLHVNGHDLVHAPGLSHAEGERFLGMVGSGVTGTGVQDLWLGHALPSIRENYYRALAGVEREIAHARAQAGSRLKDATELEKFVKWTVAKRNRVARMWRIPAGPGGMLGGEIAISSNTVRGAELFRTC